MPPERIPSLHVIGSGQFGGAERFFVRLVQALGEAGQPVAAVTRPGTRIAAALPAGVRHFPVPMRNVLDLPSRWHIRRLVSRWQPLVVQTWMGRATRLTRLRGRALHVARLGGFYKLAGYRHADAWIGNTAAICDYLRRNGFPAERVFHVPNFVAPPPPPDPGRLARLRAGLGIPDDALVVTAVGRLVAKKGFQDLLAAFARLPAEIGGRRVDLVIVGDGPMEAGLREQAAHGPAAGRLHFAGWQEDPGPYYDLADLFVCPSRHEPLGNVILEAWSHGRPVLSTDTDGARELFRREDAGMVVPVAEPRALAAAMAELLPDPAALEELGARGLDVVRRRYGPAVVVAAYQAVWSGLLAARR